MKKLFTLIIILIAFQGYAQKETESVKYASTITEDDLREHLTIVASDAFEGRETGKRGQKLAAAYIKAHFESLGLVGPVKSEYGDGYFQRVPLYSMSPGKIYLKAGEAQLDNFKDVIYFGNGNSGQEKSLEVVFGGKGTEADLAGLDMKGKAVMVYAENIRAAFGDVIARINESGAAMAVVFSQSDNEEWGKMVTMYSRYLNGGRLSVDKPVASDNSGTFFVGPTAVEAIMGTTMDKIMAAIKDNDAGKKNALKKVKGGKLVYYTEQQLNVVKSENVLGYMEGTDKKDELVIITAHYDHEGKRNGQIYNGADDDGSGTVSVLEIAEAFAKAKADGKGPRRSILFMTVTGEEKGLLGSDYYTKNPIFPLKNTVVDLNIDMVGRIDPEHEQDRNYVYLVGSNRLSSELHELSEMANTTFTNMKLDYTYNDENHPERIYYRSDHWNFAKNNIPIIFYFNGTHADYHQPTDTVEKIEFDMLAKRAQLVFHTAWVLANRDQRVMVDKIESTGVEKK